MGKKKQNPRIEPDPRQQDLIEGSAGMGGGSYAAEQQKIEPVPKPGRNFRTGPLVDRFVENRKSAFRDVVRWRELGMLEGALRKVLGEEYEACVEESRRFAEEQEALREEPLTPTVPSASGDTDQ